MKLKQEPLTAEDARLVDSQINAVLEFVKHLRAYLEQTGKLRPVELKQFKTAEGALQAMRIKLSPPRSANRASALIKRVSPPGQK